MTIERLGPVDPVSKLNKTEKSSRVEKRDSTDSITVSEEAKSLAELYQVSESVKLSPDVRMDRVMEVKEKLKDPSYLSDKVIETVADRLMQLFDL
ncbi:MAG: flagellar biosynthesis anti-sigma factor FlgM [Spirochaetales bacterium]|nr:MAG: flagellar biosynthesis anti-sigma factor FlgM [Spirochaetales bacterium]